MPKHTCCTSLKTLKMLLGLLPSFFLQSRFVVLYLGHTPGQHTQCHNTLDAPFSNFHVSLSAYRQALGMEYFVVLFVALVSRI